MFWLPKSKRPETKADVLIKEAESYVSEAYVSEAYDAIDRLNYANLIKNAEERKAEVEKQRERLKSIQTTGLELIERVGDYIKEEQATTNVRNFKLNKMYLEAKRK